MWLQYLTDMVAKGRQIGKPQNIMKCYSTLEYRVANSDDINDPSFSPITTSVEGGRPSVSLLRLTGQHFPEHIPPTGKNLLQPDSVLYAVVKPIKKGRGEDVRQEFIEKSAIWGCVQHHVLEYTIL
ncbi:hypothetical protein TNCT_425581 [Trichonephila clavata]|uniref:Uncharacterized protein n=1 Tax=Trichonephila clavata TaxID=2740835 RepID=A0A8X6IRD8_TRICU|nr:hypothetical protein TNCT_425581 [Trichonephila clavata]